MRDCSELLTSETQRRRFARYKKKRDGVTALVRRLHDSDVGKAPNLAERTCIGQRLQEVLELLGSVVRLFVESPGGANLVVVENRRSLQDLDAPVADDEVVLVPWCSEAELDLQQATIQVLLFRYDYAGPPRQMHDCVRFTES